jgi:hypothetical protein
MTEFERGWAEAIEAAVDVVWKVTDHETAGLISKKVRALDEPTHVTYRADGRPMLHEGKSLPDTPTVDAKEVVNSIGTYYDHVSIKENGDPVMRNADGSRSIFCDIDEGGGEDAAQPAAQSADSRDAKLAAMTKWLEENQPDVFRRGLWDALAQQAEGGKQS